MWSADSGKTWMYKGFAESHHIGKICLHHLSPGTAWVAVLGHLYSPNKDRGYTKPRTGNLPEETGFSQLIMQNS